MILVTTIAVTDGRANVDRETPSVADYATDLADIRDLSLADLVSIDNPILLDSLRRVLEDADGPQEIVAGFQSAI